MNSRKLLRGWLGCGALACGLLFVPACTPERDQADLFAPEGVGALVIDAVLIVDQGFPVVKLSRTLAPNVPFDPEAAAVGGASISIVVDGFPIDYQDLAGRPGSYVPGSFSPIVAPESEYHLYVATSEGEILTARTRTPARFKVDSWWLLAPDGASDLRRLETFEEYGDAVYERSANRITYAEGLVEARFAAGGAGAYRASSYQLALFSLDLDSDFVVEPAFFDEEDYESLTRTGSSPILVAEDGRVRLPWFGVFFQGRYLYKIFAVDENWYDLLRSVPQEGGGLGFGGNAGDSSGNPIFHVQGGLGLFGSASMDAVGFFILPPP